MPLDAARWQIDIMAADKTAAAFQSATARAKAFGQANAAAGRQSADAFTAANLAAKANAAGFGILTRALGPLAAGFSAAALASKVWQAGMKAGDLGEQADQVGITTDQLQAYRFAAAQTGIETEQMDTALGKLAKTMGGALKGGDEQIQLFERLGVKILDARGELRPVADVLPEVARGVLSIGSSSQKTAVLMELFGRSGAKMTTVLEELARGNDAVVSGARKQGGILENEVIGAWDKTSDAMKRASLAADVTFAKLGAPIATAGLEHFNNLIAATKDGIEKIGGAWRVVTNLFTNDSSEDLSKRQETMRAMLENIKDSTDELDVAKAAQLRRELDRISDTLASRAKVFNMPKVNATTTGAGGPVPKGQTDAYAKIIADAEQYIALKKVETDGIGMNAEAAARLKHEQELLGKATAANIALGPTQTAQLEALAAAMAAADAAFGSAKFMDEAEKKTREMIAAQEIELRTLFMSTEAAAAYRIEQELLNKAVNDNIVLTDAQKSRLGELAAAQAAAAEKTRQTKELLDLGKESMRGFVNDTIQGLRQGQSVWDAFGNAALNALNKIADKLIQMAVDDLFNAAFPSGKGGGAGGGIINLLGNLLGFGGGGGDNSFVVGGSAGNGGLATNAMGNAFSGGNVIPFRNGGVVAGPTLFPMANGAGLMGEAGPEAVVPLRRGRGGRLGIDASGVGGGSSSVVVNIYNNADGTKATARESKGPDGQRQIDVMVEMIEGKLSGRASRGQGSLVKTLQGRFGLQEQGR